MFTTSSASYPTLATRLFAQVGKDVSARPAWFIAPSGLDLYLWQVVEYPEIEDDLTETALRLPRGHLEMRHFPTPENAFNPKTELARCLWEIRTKIIASGEPLLNWDGIQKEISERRAERG